MDYHIDLVALLFGAIVFIIAFAHLKFESNQNKKEIAQIWKKHDDLSKEVEASFKEVSKELAEMKSSLSRIEGMLSVKPIVRSK